MKKILSLLLCIALLSSALNSTNLETVFNKFDEELKIMNHSIASTDIEFGGHFDLMHKEQNDYLEMIRIAKFVINSN